MAYPPRAATIRNSVAQVEASPGPDVEQYLIPIDHPAIFRWIVGDTTTIDHLETLGHTGGTIGRWKRVAGTNMVASDSSADVSARPTTTPVAFATASADEVSIGPTATLAATLTALISQGWLKFRLLAGAYTLESAVALVSGVEIRGAGIGRTIVTAGTSPSASLADDRSNCLIQAVGTLLPAVMGTNLTSTAASGRAFYGGGVRKLSVANSGTLATGNYFLVGGHDFDGDNYGNDAGDAVQTCELLRVASVAANTIVLEWNTKMHHSVASTRPTTAYVLPYVTAVNPIVGLEISGITFVSTSHAVGIRLDYAYGAHIHDCEFTGFSRSPIDIFGCLQVKTPDLFLSGNNNGGVRVTASHVVDVDRLVSYGGLRHHTNGLKLAVVIAEYGSTHVHVRQAVLGNRVQGVSMRGARHWSVSESVFEDMDIRDQVIDNVYHVGLRGAGICTGGGEGLFDEYSGPGTITKCRVVNPRVSDDALDNLNDVMQGAIVCHDTLDLEMSDVDVDIGESAASYLDGDFYRSAGVITQDCRLNASRVRVSGPYCGFVLRQIGGRVVRLDHCAHSTVAGTGTNASISLALLYGGGPGFVIEDFTAREQIMFGVHYGEEGSDHYNTIFHNLRSDTEWITGPIVVAKNPNAATHGEVYAVDATATAGTRKMKLAATDSDTILQAVGNYGVSAWPSGGWGLYAQPQRVLVNGAVAADSAIEFAIGSAVCVPAAAPGGPRTILRAIDVKGTGTAIVAGVPRRA